MIREKEAQETDKDGFNFIAGIGLDMGTKDINRGAPTVDLSPFVSSVENKAIATRSIFNYLNHDPNNTYPVKASYATESYFRKRIWPPYTFYSSETRDSFYTVKYQYEFINFERILIDSTRSVRINHGRWTPSYEFHDNIGF